MSLTVEDGSGVAGAESYATVAFIDAYWAGRTHAALYTTWTAVTTTTAKKEGAAREATAYIDATWGLRYRGVRRGYVQGLLFPRTDAFDDAGYPLPDLPAELKRAVAELAPKAIAGSLTPDIKAGGGIINRVKAGSVEVEYAVNQQVEKSYPALERMLAPILTSASGWRFGIAGA